MYFLCVTISFFDSLIKNGLSTKNNTTPAFVINYNEPSLHSIFYDFVAKLCCVDGMLNLILFY